MRDKKPKQDANYRINMDWEGTIIRAGTGEVVHVAPALKKHDANYRIHQDWDRIQIERAKDEPAKGK